MASDVGHELGAIRHIVDTPLSSKVAMFNKVASQHNASQLLNPFSNVNGGRASPKPTFNKDEYGKPIAGSMTELRGQKANIHVCKEMLELCQIIDSEGFPDSEDPEIRIIFFGDLFNIYNHISDKVVGLLLRARKHKLVDFEGEILFQRRDDDVPIFLIKPIKEVRRIMEAKQEEFRRSVSPASQPNKVLQNKTELSENPIKKKNSKSPSPQPDSNKPLATIAPDKEVLLKEDPIREDKKAENIENISSTTKLSSIFSFHIFEPQIESPIVEEKCENNGIDNEITEKIVDLIFISDNEVNKPDENTLGQEDIILTTNLGNEADEFFTGKTSVLLFETTMLEEVDTPKKVNVDPPISHMEKSTENLKGNKSNEQDSISQIIELTEAEQNNLIKDATSEEILEIAVQLTKEEIAIL